jgi:SAM-dependent methyltransferase
VPGFKFDEAKTAKLDDPGRLEDLLPDVMWEALGRPAPDAIVDLGTGTGMFAEQFALLAPHAVVYAVDTSAAMLDWLREKRAGLVEAGRLVPVLASERAVPLADRIAGLVVMVNLHHELDDPVRTYTEAYRLLGDGGQVLVADWAPRTTPKGPPLVVRALPRQIADALEEAGFTDASEHEGLPYHTLMTARRGPG